MDTISMLWIICAALIAVGLIALAVWMSYRRKQSGRLKNRFGAEYDRAVDDLGSRRGAEAELRKRERRVDALVISPLTAADAARFSGSWAALQGHFVDNPQSVVIQADELVRELMEKRGYPVQDFELRAGDISVNHPHVVQHYRAAQALRVLSDQGQATTEQLRQAVVHYRALFDELLGTGNATVPVIGHASVIR